MNAIVGQAGGIYPPACGIGVGGPGCYPGSNIIVPMDEDPEIVWTRIGALPAGQIGNGLDLAAGETGYVTFTSKCNFTAKDLYLQADVAGVPTTVDVVAMFSCTVDGQNLLGMRTMSNVIPSGLFSRVEELGCCPKFGAFDVPAMGSVVLGIQTRQPGVTVNVRGVFIGTAR